VSRADWSRQLAEPIDLGRRHAREKAEKALAAADSRGEHGGDGRGTAGRE